MMDKDKLYKWLPSGVTYKPIEDYGTSWKGQIVASDDRYLSFLVGEVREYLKPVTGKHKDKWEVVGKVKHLRGEAS